MPRIKIEAEFDFTTLSCGLEVRTLFTTLGSPDASSHTLTVRCEGTDREEAEEKLYFAVESLLDALTNGSDRLSVAGLEEPG